MISKKPPKLNLKNTQEKNLMQKGICLNSDAYLVESKLGEGSYGSVYLVLHHLLKKKIALKVIQSSNEEDHIQKLIHELENHFQCDQENIVKCYGYYLENKTLKIAMEYMDLGNLQEIYIYKKQLHQKLLFYIAFKVLKALEYLSQKKILHRDLKPSNILLSSEGDIKLADFGESGNLQETFSYKRTLVGTLLYNSPERVKGDHYYLNCDIWSLGIILLEGSIGRNPLVRTNEKKQDLNYINFIKRVEENFPEVPPEYSDEFRELVSLCLIKNPRERPQAQDLLKLKCMQKQAKVNKESMKTLFNVIRNQIVLQKEIRTQNLNSQEMNETNFMRKTNKVWDEFKQLNYFIKPFQQLISFNNLPQKSFPIDHIKKQDKWRVFQTYELIQ